VPKEMGVTAPATSMPTSIVPPACRRRNVPLRRALICCVGCACARIEPTHLPVDAAGMADKPEPPPELTAWSVYKIAKRAEWLGIVETPDGAAAIETAAADQGAGQQAAGGEAVTRRKGRVMRRVSHPEPSFLRIVL
jgi:hypothetical protein